MGFTARPSLCFLLVGLVILAGCLGGTATDGDPADDSSVGTSNPVASGATDGGDAPASESAHPLASKSLATSHVTSLRDAESFTLEYSVEMTQTTPNETQQFAFDWTVEADLGSGAQAIHADMAGITGDDPNGTMTIDLYVSPDGTAYQRSSFGGVVQYQQVSTENYNLSTYLTAMDATAELDPEASNFTYKGTTTVDGETLHIYAVSDLNQLYVPTDAATTAQFDTDSITVFDLRLLVDDAGVVREMTYDVELTEADSVMRLQFELHYTDIGTTVVEEPEWVSEAEPRV